jgi:O-antigen/teichoic acid export membrane protein
MSSKSLTKRAFVNTINYGFGTVLPKIIGFLLIPLYTILLTPEDYGVAELTSVLGVFLVVLMRLGIPGAIQRFYFDFKKKQDYLTTMFWFLTLVSVLIGGITLILSYFYLDNFIPELSFQPFIPLVIITSILSPAYILQRKLIIIREQSKFSMLITTSKAFVGISFTLLLVVYFRLGALGLVLAGTITSFIFFIQSVVYLWSDIRGKFRSSLLGDSLKYGFTIFPSHIVANISPIVSRTLLSVFGTFSAVGVFGIASRFASPLIIIVTAFNAAYMPIYFSIRKENTAFGLEKLANLIKNIWFVSCVLFLVFYLLIPSVAQLMTPENYQGVEKIIPILAIGFLFHVIYILLGMEIIFNKSKTYWHPVLAFTNVIVNLSVVFFLVKKYGAIGVAVGQTSGYVVSGMGVLVLSIMLKVIRVPYFFFMKTVGLMLIVILSHDYIVESFLNGALAMNMGVAIILIVAFIFYFVLTREFDYKQLLTFLRQKSI